MIMPKMKRSNDDTSSPSLRNSEWNIMLHKVLTIVNSALQRIVFPQNNSNMFDLASARNELYLAAALLDKDSITMKNFGLSITDELSTVKSVVQMLLHLPQLQQFPERDDIVSSIGSQLPSAGLSCTSFGTCDDMVSYEDDSENRSHGVHFCDIVGAHEAKQVLHENVVLPLTLSPAKRQRFLTGIRCGCGNVLLYGPPGTGKTMLAEAAANEAGAALQLIKPSDVLSKYHGESEAYLKRIFASLTNSMQPTVLFFDEFDSLACTRSNGDDGLQGRRLLAELLLQLNELRNARKRGGEFVVIAATNRIEEIDEAAIRRFETRVHVDVPQESERVMLIANFLKPGHIEHRLSPADLKEIASWTQGWSGSDLESMVRDAAFAPVRRAFPIGYHEKVTMDADVDSNCDEDDQAEQSKWKLLVTLDDFKMAYDRATSHC